MRAAACLEPLYREAARVTAAGSKSFYFATRFFPPELARAAHAVYWFCRQTDDLADEAPSDAEGLQAVEEWATGLRRGLDGGEAGHPALDLFCGVVRAYRIPHEYPLDLIEGMRMDLTRRRYESFAELRLFCYRAASVVGLMMMHVIGFREPAPRYAADLGIAMQLTNILRDVGEDLNRGRIYLPADEMAAFGYTAEELRNRIRNDAFRRLMAHQVRRAREYYRTAEPGVGLLDPRGRFAVKVASGVYGAILREIEAADYDVFGRRAVVPSWRKRWIAGRAMAIPAARNSVGRLVFRRTQ